MLKRSFPLFVTIKSRLYLGFFLLVLLFIVNGVITLVVLQKNKNLSNHISTVIDPATNSLIELNQVVIESKMLSSNWVFVRSNKEDKDALLNIHSTRYPQLRSRLNELTPQLFDKAINDSLQKMYADFDQLIVVQKEIIAALNSFESYDNAFIKMEMELRVEDEIIPRTASLLSAMNRVILEEQAIRLDANTKLERSSVALRYVLVSLAVLVIIIGIIFSMYLVRIITNPIHQLREIIYDMGVGKLKIIDYKDKQNEIGLMVDSVNNLSENLKASAKFAREIGKRNFETDFKPISKDDVLGESLITMRDNLKESDYRLNQAQHIAKLGSWEFNLNTLEVVWSDELYNILGYTQGTSKPGLAAFMDTVLAEHKPKIKNLLAKGVTGNEFHFECRVLTANNILKDLFIQGKAEQGIGNTFERIVGIVQDISIQKKAEEELQQNNAELLKANKELDKFVYSVSHDLRAPLSSMLGIVQLTEEDCEDSLIKENLGLVKGSILKLDGFIQDILSYSRNARLDVRQDEILFNELLTDITGNLKYMGGVEKDVKIITNVSQESAFKSDNSRLSIILNNLISNAIRYHNPAINNSFVEANIKVDALEAKITVTDNGIGIRKDLHQKVFDIFYRVAENSVGSGLGLYIVKETVDKLKGNIQLDSEPGVGTRFTITIPNL